MPFPGSSLLHMALRESWAWFLRKPLRGILSSYIIAALAMIALGDDLGISKGVIRASVLPLFFGLLVVGFARVACVRWALMDETQRGPARERVRRWGLRAAAGGFLVIAAATSYVEWKHPEDDDGPPPPPPKSGAGAGSTNSLAILPFSVSSGDPALSVSLARYLDTNLRPVVGIDTQDPNTVLFYWDSMIGGRRAMTWHVLRVARRVGANVALTGDVDQLPNLLRITARIYDVPEEVAEGQFTPRHEFLVQGIPDSLLVLVNDLGKKILQVGFGRTPREIPDQDVGRALSDSLSADAAFFAAEEEFRLSHWDNALEQYRKAVSIDSTFSLALLRLSLVHGWKQGVGDSSSIYAERALRHSHGLLEPDSLLVRGNWEYHEQDVRALETLRTLTARYPQNALGWYALAEANYHIGPRALVSREETQAAFKRTIDLYPNFGPAYIHLIQDAFSGRDSVAGGQYLQKFQRIDAVSPQARGLDLASALAWGDSARTKRALESAPTLPSAVLQQALSPLVHGGYLKAAETVAGWLRNEPHGDNWRKGAQRSLAAAYTGAGRLNDAYRALQNVPGYKSLTGWDARTLMMWNVAGLFEADSLTRAKAIELLVTIAPVEPMDWFLAGTQRLDWNDASGVDEAIGKLDSIATGVTGGTSASADSAQGAVARSLALALRGLKAGGLENDKAAQMRDLRSALPGVPGFYEDQFSLLHAVLRYRAGLSLAAADSGDQAERYLKTVEFGYNLSIVHFLLGLINESRGESRQALEHYRRFVTAWANCDSVLQPRLNDVRQRIQRLESVAARSQGGLVPATRELGGAGGNVAGEVLDVSGSRSRRRSNPRLTGRCWRAGSSRRLRPSVGPPPTSSARAPCCRTTGTPLRSPRAPADRSRRRRRSSGIRRSAWVESALNPRVGQDATSEP